MIDYDSLNPGIRRVVRLLNDHGFETTDSGDGKTREHACDREGPYVVVRSSPERVIIDSHAILLLFLRAGLRWGSGNIMSADILIQANYSPLDGYAFVDVAGIDDSMIDDLKG